MTFVIASEEEDVVMPAEAGIQYPAAYRFER